MALKVYKNLTDRVLALMFRGPDGDTARLYIPPNSEKSMDWPGELITRAAPGELQITED